MIPMARDVRGLIGDFADGVDNRSLLYQKFTLPKVWGQFAKVNDAGRWSVLRIVSRGAVLLKKDVERMEYSAGGRNVRPENAEKLQRDAQIARKLSVIALPDPDLAKKAAENARRLLADLDKSQAGAVATFQARLGGRLIVNQAGGVVENAGICLDRCFGLPYLPGSAVKGIARAQAIIEIKELAGEHRERLLQLAMMLFGFGGNDLSVKGDFALDRNPQLAQALAKRLKAKEFKGIASFLPAYPTEPPKLVVDMVNPHHRKYYRSRGDLPATDDEDPMPNYFPAVEAGCRFGFAVVLNRIPTECPFTAKELLETAQRWLEQAITRKGAGAKTAAGYGWFRAPGQEPPTTVTSSSDSEETPAGKDIIQTTEDPIIQTWRGRLASTGNFPAVLPILQTVDDVARLLRVFEAIFPAHELYNLRAGKRTSYWQSFSSRPQGDAILKKLGYRFGK